MFILFWCSSNFGDRTLIFPRPCDVMARRHHRYNVVHINDLHTYYWHLTGCYYDNSILDSKDRPRLPYVAGRSVDMTPYTCYTACLKLDMMAATTGSDPTRPLTIGLSGYNNTSPKTCFCGYEFSPGGKLKVISLWLRLYKSKSKAKSKFQSFIILFICTITQAQHKSFVHF